jgi:hypothetical protein
VLSLITNETLLYPIYANVLLIAKTLYSDLTSDTNNKVIAHVQKLLRTHSHVLGVDLNLSYAVRLLSCADGPENEEILNRIFRQTGDISIRRDVIIAMARWNAWYWLSNLRGEFRTLSPIERRAFIIASYALKDEGKHWRDHIAQELSPFERLIKQWASEKSQIPGWSAPL